MFRRRWGLESGGKNINRFTSTLRIQDGALTGLFLSFTFNDQIHWRSNLVTSKTPTFTRFQEEHFNILIFFYYLEKWVPPVNPWFKAFIWSRSLFFPWLYPLSNPPKDGYWELVTASIQIRFLHRNETLAWLIKPCLLWNHVLIEIIVQRRTPPTPQMGRCSQSKQIIDFFVFFPGRSRHIDDKRRDRNTKQAFSYTPIR